MQRLYSDSLNVLNFARTLKANYKIVVETILSTTIYKSTKF